MYNRVILVGHLTRDVELRYIPSGTALAKFGLATNRRFKQDGMDRDETCFIDINVWGRSAEIAGQYLKKGSKVLVEGRLKFEQWVDQNGQKRSKHSVIADSIQFMESKAESQRNSAQQNSWGNQNQRGGGYSANHDNFDEPNQPMNQNKTNNVMDDDDIPF